MLNEFIRGLAKTRAGIMDRILGLLGRQPDSTVLELLEENLIRADAGPKVAEEIVQSLRQRPSDSLIPTLVAEIEKRVAVPVPEDDGARPRVILFVGVNGCGKTTTIGKLAAKFTKQGQKVILAAGDTFRAAAVDQLALWAERAGAELVSSQPGSDPAAVAYDAISAGIARRADYVLIDTAGRLQTRTNLIEELKKIKRVAAKAMAGAPQEVWLVLDATIGQNTLSQVELFHRAVNLTGVVLAKLDGTAKGGAILAICQNYRLPVRYVGLGEGVDDLAEFNASQFAKALVQE